MSTMPRKIFCLVLFFSLLSATWAQLTYDESLKKACDQMGGHFRKRENPQSTSGDKCAMKFNAATRDDEDARDLCELYAPWRLEKAERSTENGRSITICHVEATYTCLDGWVQMFGMCFRMPNKAKVATYQEAEKICAAENAKIAFMHHRYIVGIWRRYFRRIGQIWVRATETWDKYIQKTGAADGNSLALAFTGIHYEFTVPHSSLIKIDSDIQLQVLCEYEPPMTPAEINYLGRRYSEIYYPTVPVDNGILVRSASSYTRSSPNLDVCKNTLKPFKIDDVGVFVPFDEVLQQIANHPSPMLLLTRSGAEARMEQDSLKKDTCEFIPFRFRVKVPGLKSGDYDVKNVPDNIQCDNMLSAAITHFNDKESKLLVMSDSRSLPYWCKLGHPTKFTYEVPDNYAAFERSNGEVVGHRLHTDLVVQAVAKKRCEDEGAVLAGINSLKEANALGELVEKAGATNRQFYIGGVRKQECMGIALYTPGDKDPCSRNKCMVWENNVATEFHTDWWRDGPVNKNPSHQPYQHQEFLSYVHGTPYWADGNLTRFLDDVEKTAMLGFFCTKKISFVVVS